MRETSLSYILRKKADDQGLPKNHPMRQAATDFDQASQDFFTTPESEFVPVLNRYMAANRKARDFLK